MSPAPESRIHAFPGAAAFAPALALALASCAADPPVPGPSGVGGTISPEFALEAVRALRRDPLSEDAGGYASVALLYAEHHDDVLVVLDPALFECEASGPVRAPEPILLGSFIAGNLEYQLVTGVRENRPVEGLSLMLDTYAALHGADRLAGCDRYDEWIGVDRRGGLAELVERLETKDDVAPDDG